METLKTRIKRRILFNICRESCWNLSNRDIQIVEGNSWNGQSECYNCHKTIYWNACCVNRKSKRKCPLDKPYYEGDNPSRHVCIGRRALGIKYDPSGKPLQYTNYMAIFMKKYVVWGRDNNVMKEAKIQLWKKLVGWDDATGTMYVERLLK